MNTQYMVANVIIWLLYISDGNKYYYSADYD